MNKAHIVDWQLSFGYPNATEPKSHTTGNRTTIDTCLMKSWGAASTKQGQSEIWSLSVFELRSSVTNISIWEDCPQFATDMAKDC